MQAKVASPSQLSAPATPAKPVSQIAEVPKSSHLPTGNPFVPHNPQIQYQSQREQTLKKLIDMNQKYLIDKITLKDVPKPSQYSHKIPSKTGYSEYSRKYGSQNKGIEVSDSTPVRDKAGSFLKLNADPIVCYASTYHIDYTGKKKEKNSLDNNVGKKTIFEKKEGPTFLQTSYHREYGSVKDSPTKSAKRAEVRLMGGGKFNGDSTYNQNYRSKTQTMEVSRPVIHKDNKIFVEMANPHLSSYQQTFMKNRSKTKVEPSCKPVQKYNPTKTSMKYKTEYNEVYVERQIHKNREVECLTHEQLKNYVMGILND